MILDDFKMATDIANGTSVDPDFAITDPMGKKDAIVRFEMNQQFAIVLNMLAENLMLVDQIRYDAMDVWHDSIGILRGNKTTLFLKNEYEAASFDDVGGTNCEIKCRYTTAITN